MERLNGIHKQDLTAGGFALYSIWVWDDEQEGYHSLIGSGAFPDQFGTCFIKAAFKAANGKDLDGYLVGVQSFYAFGLFVGNQEYLINLSVPDLAEAEHFSSLLPSRCDANF